MLKKHMMLTVMLSIAMSNTLGANERTNELTNDEKQQLTSVDELNHRPPPPRPYPPRRPAPPRPYPPQRPYPPYPNPTPARYICYSENQYGYTFSAVGYYPNQVQQDALNACYYNHYYNSCRALGCRLY